MQSNFSTASSGLLYHYEVINYTNQNTNYIGKGPARVHKTFTAPYTQYRIALFLTGIGIYGTGGIPLYLDIAWNIIDSSRYSMSATLGTQVKVTVL